MRRKLSQLLGLSWPDRWLLAKAALTIVASWTGLRLLGFARLHRLMETPGAARGRLRPSPDPDRLIALVSLAGNAVPFFSTCLTRSLALVWLLRRRGIDGELRIGVEPVDGGFGSHAWVERGGLPINEERSVTGRFAVLDVKRAGALPHRVNS